MKCRKSPIEYGQLLQGENLAKHLEKPKLENHKYMFHNNPAEVSHKNI